MCVQIIKLSKERWEEFRDLRLFALKNEKFSFLTTFNEESKKDSVDWQRKLNSTFFAESSGKLIGMASYAFLDKERAKHICNIFAVYLLPEFRGQGIAQKLFDKIIDDCKKNSIKKIELEVFANNISATKFYEKNGFEIIGKFQKKFLIDGKYYDEFLMEKFI